MENWSEIRRRVLVEGVSRRQILRKTGMHWRTLRKMLEHVSYRVTSRASRGRVVTCHGGGGIGTASLARLNTKLPEVQIVILTAMDNQELLFMALKAGADRYLLKQTKPADLLDVLNGGVPMTSQIARWLIASVRKNPETKDESLKLSVREEQILELVSKGHSNKLIADKLNMSFETVCTHLKRVFKKLHLNSQMSEQRLDENVE